MNLIFFNFFLYTEFSSDVSQDSGSNFLCFHGNVQYGNRRSVFLNYEQNVLKFFKNSTFLNFSRTVSSRHS